MPSHLELVGELLHATVLVAACTISNMETATVVRTVDATMTRVLQNRSAQSASDFSPQTWVSQRVLQRESVLSVSPFAKRFFIARRSRILGP